MNHLISNTSFRALLMHMCISRVRCWYHPNLLVLQFVMAQLPQYQIRMKLQMSSAPAEFIT